MDMQMQLKRGVIALMIWAALGGLVLSRAGTPVDADGQRAALLAPAALTNSRACARHLRVDLGTSLRVTLPCDRSCGPIRNVARFLRLPTATVGDGCETWRTA